MSRPTSDVQAFEAHATDAALDDLRAAGRGAVAGGSVCSAGSAGRRLVSQSRHCLPRSESCLPSERHLA